MRFGLIYWMLRPLIRGHRHATRVLVQHVSEPPSPHPILDFFGAIWVIVQLLFTLAYAVCYVAVVLVMAAAMPALLYLLFNS